MWTPPLHFKIPWWELKKKKKIKYLNHWANFEETQLVPNSHQEIAVLDSLMDKTELCELWYLEEYWSPCQYTRSWMPPSHSPLCLHSCFMQPFQMTVFSFSAQIKVNSFFKYKCVWSTVNSEVFNTSFWFALLKKHEEAPTFFTDNKHCPVH